MPDPARQRRGVLAVAAVAALAAIVAVVVIATSLVRAARAGATVMAPASVVQPIQYNHKLHIDQEMECTTCHEGADSQPHATIPVIAKCMECHSEPASKSPEEAKIRTYAAKGEEIPWIRVNRLPGHVYFSHRAHVKWAGLGCDTCHGDMRSRTTPVTSSQILALTMSRCLDCHEAKGARTDCLTCHK